MDCAIEIVSVSTPEEAPKQLAGASIDCPSVGDQAEEQALHVAAWAIGQNAPVAAVELVSDDRVLLVAPLRVPRPDLEGAYSQSPEAGLAGMAVNVDASKLPKEFQIRLDAVLQSGERVEIGTISGRRGPAEMPEAPTLRGDVLGLLQNLAPDGVDDNSDEALLSHIRLTGKRVLLLGAGLGGTCRAARRQGAALVDGIEPDEKQAQIARLLNAYHHASRVSIYSREIAVPDAYNEPYDIVLALSPFDDLAAVLDKVAGITDGVLLTTLPDLEKSLASIGSSFQHHEVLDADKGLVAAAHSKDALAAVLQADDAVARAT
jgi:hypothetical protein